MSMLFDVRHIKEGATLSKFELNDEKFSTMVHPDFLSFVKGRIEINSLRTGDNLYISCNLMFTLRLRCARCLQPYDIDLEDRFEFSVKLVETGFVLVELWEDDHINANMFEGRIDLTRRIIDSFYLSIPSFPLCSENCKGLCPICGNDLNHTQCNCKSANRSDSPFRKLAEIYHPERSKNGTT